MIQMRSRVLGYILDARAGARGRTAPQDRAASGGKKYSNPSRGAEIRIRIDVSSDTCLRIENRYAARSEAERCAARVDGEKNIQISTRAGCDESRLCRAAFERMIYLRCAVNARALDMR